MRKRSIINCRGGKWHDSIKSFFTGYKLKGIADISSQYVLGNTPGIFKTLGDNHGLYCIFTRKQLINRLMCNGAIIEQSVGFKRGDSVVIAKGPLLGMEDLRFGVDSRCSGPVGK